MREIKWFDAYTSMVNCGAVTISRPFDKPHRFTQETLNGIWNGDKHHPQLRFSTSHYLFEGNIRARRN